MRRTPPLVVSPLTPALAIVQPGWLLLRRACSSDAKFCDRDGDTARLSPSTTMRRPLLTGVSVLPGAVGELDELVELQAGAARRAARDMDTEDRTRFTIVGRAGAPSSCYGRRSG